MPSGANSHWSCFLCKAETKQRNCCGLKTCEHSLFAQKTMEQMWEHLIRVHGYKKPAGWDEAKQAEKNKAKAKRKKDKKKKRKRK